MGAARLRPQANVGGSAASAGESFQRSVAAWLATYVLQETEGVLPLDLPAASYPTILWCQAPTAIDDIVVEMSDRGVIFVQAKRSLSLSDSTTSPLAFVLDQLVRQFLDSRTAAGTSAWDRPLDRSRDRFIIATSGRSPNVIKQDLKAVCERARTLPAGTALQMTAQSVGETSALESVSRQVKAAWERCLGVVPTENEILEVIGLTEVLILNDTSPGIAGQSQERLRQTVLADPAQSISAWALLTAECERLAVQRSFSDRSRLVEVLQGAGIQLKAARSYQADIDRLRDMTLTSLKVIGTHTSIPVDSNVVRLERPVVLAMRAAIEKSACLVTGKPGAGKSAVLAEVVTHLLEDRCDLVLVLADRYVGDSPNQLREELRLEHDLVDVLEHWPGRGPGILVIDALDAARAEPAARTLRQVMEAVKATRGRWRVVASVRMYDLRASAPLQLLFAGAPSTEFSHPEFSGIAHVHVPLLGDGELAEASRQAPSLGKAIDESGPELRELLRVPFNLRLLGEIVATLGPDVDLRGIRTDVDLLDRYWTARVIRGDFRGDARESIVHKACERMVAARSMRVSRVLVVDASSAADLLDLLSTTVLIEWQPIGYDRPEPQILAFSHNVLFDYAVARMLFRADADGINARLVTEPQLVLMLQPSLRLHFKYLWARAAGGAALWQACIAIAKSDRMPEIARVVGPAVAATLVRSPSDCDALLAALTATEPATREAAECCFRHLVGNLLANDPSRLREGGSPWPFVAERAAEHLSDGIAYSVTQLLAQMTEAAAS